MATPKQQLDGFLARYPPAVGKLGRVVLARMRKLVPGAIELVYDNYNALVIGFGPTERASEAIFSVALYPRWVSLFFLQGAKLKDPSHRLNGQGKQVRGIRIDNVATLDEPEVRALIDDALQRSAVPVDAGARRRLVIKSISAKQRPRRPARG